MSGSLSGASSSPVTSSAHTWASCLHLTAPPSLLHTYRCTHVILNQRQSDECLSLCFQMTPSACVQVSSQQRARCECNKAPDKTITWHLFPSCVDSLSVSAGTSLILRRLPAVSAALALCLKDPEGFSQSRCPLKQVTFPSAPVSDPPPSVHRCTGRRWPAVRWDQSVRQTSWYRI